MSAETKRGARTRVLIPGRPRTSGASGFISSARDPAVAEPSRSWSRSGQDEQVVGDHAQPDPALHPARAAVPTSPQPVATFERADAPFAAGAPAECPPLPLALSLAVFPGWLQPALVVGLFLVLEPITGSVMEPWLYGQSAGVSQVALLIA